MYEATKKEWGILGADYGYSPKEIRLMEFASDNVRRGVSVDLGIAIRVIKFQETLKLIRKSQKRWWQFWK